jgi:hypothetical protein
MAINSIENLTRCLEDGLSINWGYNSLTIEMNYFLLNAYKTGEVITEGYIVYRCEDDKDEVEIGYFPKENLYELSKLIDEIKEECEIQSELELI